MSRITSSHNVPPLNERHDSANGPQSPSALAIQKQLAAQYNRLFSLGRTQASPFQVNSQRANRLVRSLSRPPNFKKRPSIVNDEGFQFDELSALQTDTLHLFERTSEHDDQQSGDQSERHSGRDSSSQAAEHPGVARLGKATDTDTGEQPIDSGFRATKHAVPALSFDFGNSLADLAATFTLPGQERERNLAVQEEWLRGLLNMRERYTQGESMPIITQTLKFSLHLLEVGALSGELPLLGLDALKSRASQTQSKTDAPLSNAIKSFNQLVPLLLIGLLRRPRTKAQVNGNIARLKVMIAALEQETMRDSAPAEA